MAGAAGSQPDAATVLKQMQQMQESLGVSLGHIEAAIAQREKRYLDDAQQAGNLVHVRNAGETHTFPCRPCLD